MCPVLSPTSFVARRRGGVSEQTHLYNQYGILSLRSGPLRSGRLGGFLLWCAILVLTRPANVALVFIVAIRLSMSSGKSMSSLCPHVSRRICHLDPSYSYSYIGEAAGRRSATSAVHARSHLASTYACISTSARRTAPQALHGRAPPPHRLYWIIVFIFVLYGSMEPNIGLHE